MKLNPQLFFYKNVPNGHSPMLQIMSQPQTNNYSSDFNSRAVDVMLEAQRIMCGVGSIVTFAMISVGGVSCDSEYLKNQLRGFLRGETRK